MWPEITLAHDLRYSIMKSPHSSRPRSTVLGCLVQKERLKRASAHKPVLFGEWLRLIPCKELQENTSGRAFLAQVRTLEEARALQGGWGAGLISTALARVFESKSIPTETQAGFMSTAARRNSI